MDLSRFEIQIAAPAPHSPLSAPSQSRSLAIDQEGVASVIGAIGLLEVQGIALTRTKVLDDRVGIS